MNKLFYIFIFCFFVEDKSFSSNLNGFDDDDDRVLHRPAQQPNNSTTFSFVDTRKNRFFSGSESSFNDATVKDPRMRVGYLSSCDKQPSEDEIRAAPILYRAALRKNRFNGVQPERAIIDVFILINDLQVNGSISAINSLRKHFGDIDPDSNIFMLVKYNTGHVGCLTYKRECESCLTFDPSLLSQNGIESYCQRSLKVDANILKV